MSLSNAWRVLPHGKLEELSPNLLRVEGTIERGPPLRRVMTAARMTDGRVVLHSPIALEEPAMVELESFGPVAFLLVPNHMHRLDAPQFAARYPEARVLCPPAGRKKVEAVTRVDGTYDDFPADERVRLEILDGTRGVEGIMLVQEAEGTTLVVNDALFNMPHLPGVGGFVLRYITGSSGGPRVSRLARALLVKDKPAFRANLERLASLPNLRRIVVSHHEVIDEDPAGVLRQVAATL